MTSADLLMRMQYSTSVLTIAPAVMKTTTASILDDIRSQALETMPPISSDPGRVISKESVGVESYLRDWLDNSKPATKTQISHATTGSSYRSAIASLTAPSPAYKKKSTRSRVPK